MSNHSDYFETPPVLNADGLIDIPDYFCKLCNEKLVQSDFQSNLAQRGIIIAACPTKHYTLHRILDIDEFGEFRDWFTDFIFINGFEVQRSKDVASHTSVWFGEHRQLLNLDRAVSDEEFVNMFHSYSRMCPML